ncbi:MAG: ABC transporter permease [Acidobacteria bacterium]|nr:ABC transporter permease [Acidobacteriota bacterium]
MQLRQELSLALRLLRKNPGFCLIAVLTLALGIGASTAIFSVVYGVLLQPLAYPDAERIVQVHTKTLPDRVSPRMTGGDWIDVQRDTSSYEALSSYGGGEMGVQLRDRSEFTGVQWVNPGFFRVFRTTPVAGTLPGLNENDQAALVSETFARRNFGGAAEALDKTFQVEAKTIRIAGVAASLHFPQNTDVWIVRDPLPTNRNRSAFNYRVVARLKQGRDVVAAQIELDAMSARLAAAFPATNKERRLLVTPLRDQLTGPVRLMLYFLLGSVGLVLLIACANVANLLLAQASARSREFAVRVALGAGRLRLMRQLMVENALLGLMGGALGVTLAALSLDALLAVSPNLPRMGEVTINWPVLVFSTMLSLSASFLFGLAPAWEATRGDVQEALKLSATRGALGGRSHRTRQILAIAEIAFAVVLAAGAGLFFRSLLALHSSELGYKTQGLLVMYAHAPANSLPEHIKAGRMLEGINEELRAVPGVASTASIMGLPTGRYGSNGSYAIEGIHRGVEGEKMPEAGFRLTSPGYFQTMGIPLVRGRDFGAQDQYDAPFVAIVSQALARQSFPNQDPIGKRLRCGLDSPNWMTIVGVVGDVRQASPAAAPEPELYMPLLQHPYMGNEVQTVLRTSIAAASLVETVRQQVRRQHPEVATRFTTMEVMISESIASHRFRALLASVFAGLALLLAMAGIYGVMSCMVAERTSEMGLRMALGASPGDILRLVLSQAGAVTGIGLACGVVLSFAAHRVVESMLFGLKPADPATYLGVVCAVLLAALSAAVAPAVRASRTDPQRSLTQ